MMGMKVSVPCWVFYDITLVGVEHLVSAWGGWKCKLPTQPSLAWVVGPQFSSVLFTGVELLLSKCFCLFYVASLEVPWLVLLLAL